MNRSLEVIFWSETNVRTLLPTVLAMALFSLWIRKLLLHKSDRAKNIPFVTITIVLLALEVLKQLIEISNGYLGYYALPLHFSSIFLFIYPLAHFTKGRLSQTMKSITGPASLMSALFLLLFPMDVIGDSAKNFFTSFAAFHTVFYHYALVLYAMMFLSLEMHLPKPNPDLKRLFLTYTIYTVVAAPASNLLKTNYNSFYTCGFEPGETFRQQMAATLGVLPAQFIYVFIMYLSILFFGFVTFQIDAIVARRMAKGSLTHPTTSHVRWLLETFKKTILKASCEPGRIGLAFALSTSLFYTGRFI